MSNKLIQFIRVMYSLLKPALQYYSKPRKLIRN